MSRALCTQPARTCTEHIVAMLLNIAWHFAIAEEASHPPHTNADRTLPPHAPDTSGLGLWHLGHHLLVPSCRALEFGSWREEQGMSQHCDRNEKFSLIHGHVSLRLSGQSSSHKPAR